MCEVLYRIEIVKPFFKVELRVSVKGISIYSIYFMAWYSVEGFADVDGNS